MPFRTRDFAIFLFTVAFLVIGIAATVRLNITSELQSAAVISFSESSEDVVYKAVLPEAPADERSSRLAVLRDKIAKLVLQKPDEVVEAPVEDEVETGTEAVATVVTINTCPNFTKINPAWSTANIKFEVVEGARIIYREVASAPVLDELGQSVANNSSREVLLQLPLQSFPVSQKTCLNTDIVGVALDGSLIRNNEHTIYQVFGSETLIGYALDGFPIYGLNKQLKTDLCGGGITGGEYRYYLSSEREGVLGCFGGSPVSL